MKTDVTETKQGMRVCDKCGFLLHKYARKVEAFLKNPPKEWMEARGYDRDWTSFSKDCEIWKKALRGACDDRD